MLKLEKITMEYAKPLFNEVTFVLGNKEKVGLIGLNGTGKTTLLRIIAGEEQPMGGNVILANEKVGYLPQIFDITVSKDKNSNEESQSLETRKLEYLGEFLEDIVENPYTDMWRVNKILNILDFGEVDEFQTLETLSPGMQMKLYLAKLLIEEPTILLLDEPTNHLDITGVTWFENFVKEFEGICIMISHDREFINNSANRIFEIDEQNINIFEGNYEDYLVQKEHWLEERRKQYLSQERKREKLEAMIDLIKKQGSGEAQGRALSAVRSRMKREVLANEVDQYRKLEIKGLELKGGVPKSKKILEIKDLSFSYSKLNNSEDGKDKKSKDGSRTILENLNLEIYGSQKVWIKGPNGTGKSTLIKLITGELEPTEGSIKIGDNLSWIYFAQNQANLNVDDTVQEYFFKYTELTWDRTFGTLEKFLFDKELRNVPVKKLSPGQKARLFFSIFAQKEYNFLILDEPTNHLDLYTKSKIEEALREFKGAILLVSHDRHFARQLNPDRVLTIEGKKLVQID